MRNSKREKLMLKIATATLLMGAFSPLAEANILNKIFNNGKVDKEIVDQLPESDEEAQVSETSASTPLEPRKRGVNVQELGEIVQDLEIRQTDGKLLFGGYIPSRCATSEKSPYKVEDGKHVLTIRLSSECENDFKPKAGEKLIDVAEVIKDVKLEDADGAVYLRTLRKASINAEKNYDEELLKTTKNEEIVLTSTKTKDDEKRLKEEEEAETEAERLAQEEKLKRDASYDALADRLFQLCQDNDYVGLTKAINDASEFLGDVSSMLDQANDGLQGKLKKDLAKADTADKAQEAYEAYLAAASEHGWDEDEITQSYIEKRFELLASLAEEVEEDSEEGSTSYKQVDRAAKEWSVELKALDRKEYKANQEKFGEIYSGLGTKAANAGDISRAETYYDKAKRFVGADTDIKIDGAMAKIYTEKYKECVKNGPWKMEACDKKFLSKIKNRADSIKATLGGQSGDDAAEELAAFQAEYIGLFGAGASMNVSGFGQVSQMPGSIQKFKAQTYQEYMQQKQMEMMTQQMYGGMGGGMAAQPGSNFLGF